MRTQRKSIAGAGLAALVALPLAIAQRNESTPASSTSAAASNANKNAVSTPADVLSSDEWRRVDAAVKRALDWLAAQQTADGSFPTLETGQPGVTSLCM